MRREHELLHMSEIFFCLLLLLLRGAGGVGYRY